MDLTLDELVAAVGERIAGSGLAQANGQVSPLPDRRTLRYYTTLGLLDRPHAVRDRQAMYGERHLLQALAVKRLQSDGLALAEIQARLSGLPMADVAAIADGRVAPVDRTERFWAGRPGPEAAPGSANSCSMANFRAAAPNIGASARMLGPTPAEPDRSVQPLLAIPLGFEVTVLIAGGPVLNPDQLAAIREAAGPLLAHLAAAGLAGAEPKDHQ